MLRLFTLAMLLSVLGCRGSSFDENAWKRRGAEAISPFKVQLKQALVEGMKTGPTDAINACRIQAPKIAAGLSNSKLKVGRTSHKLRNQSNAPEDWMAPLIDRYLGGATEPIAVQIDKGVVGYVEPIMTQPLCLTCHGSTLPPAIEAEIAKLYPSDAATGFEVGELRGLFWAELSN